MQVHAEFQAPLLETAEPVARPIYLRENFSSGALLLTGKALSVSCQPYPEFL
jgi:hypothetical protein